MSNVPLLGSYMEGIVKEMLEEYVDEYVEEYVKLIREVVEDNYAQGAVDALVERLLKLRDTINENPEYAKDISNFFKGFSDIENATEIGAAFLRFVPDEGGVCYHSKPNTWQRKFGYSIFYDELFAIGSAMNADKIPFSTDDEEYVLWMWKGDYWNLGSGAEIGIYCDPDKIEGADYYDVIDFELPMTLGLYNYYGEDNIECILNWAPRIKQWWITAFNPEFDEPICNDMVMIGSVDFEGREEMYEGLKEVLENEYVKYSRYFIFDEDGKTVWIIWNKKEELLSGKIKHRITGRSNASGM